MAKEEILIDLKIDEGDSIQSINSLRAANRELTKSRNELNLTTAEGQKELKLLNDQINKNNELIKTNSSALEKQRLNVGSYKADIVAAAKETDVFGVNVGSATTKMASFANPVTAAVGVLSALGAAYARSSIGAKDLEFASNQLSAATTILTDKFASLFSSVEDGEGVLSKFVDRVLFSVSPTTAILSNLAARAKEEIDTINEESGLVQQKVNERLAENADILTEIANKELGVAKRKELVLLAQENITKNANDRLALIDREIEQQQILRATVKDTGDIDKAINQLRAERSGIETQSEKGKERLEKQLNNILAQETKANEIIQEQNKNLETQKLIREAQAEILQRSTENRELLGVTDRLAKQEDSQQKEIESLGAHYQQKIHLTEELNEKEGTLTEQQTKLILKNIKVREANEKALYENRLNIASGFFGAISNLLGRNTAEGKAAAVAQIGVSTAEGISKATAAGAGVPFPGNLPAILIGITSVLSGIAQAKNALGFARGGFLSLFHNGGMLNGPSHADGGIPFSVGGRLGFEAEGGEAIINKRSTTMFRPILSHLNALGGGVRFADGGIPGFPSTSIDVGASSFFDYSRFEQLIASQKVVVTVEDINAGQQRVAEVENRATL